MKKYLSYIVTFIGGLLIGTIILSAVFMKLWSNESTINIMNNIGRLENIVYKIYKIGDFNSSVVALNELINYLEYYLKIIKIDKGIHDLIVEDSGLTYARLFILFEKAGKQDLANQNYQKAIELIGSRFKIKSQEELKELMGKIDKSIRISK